MEGGGTTRAAAGPSPVRLLPDLLVDQIAAGEVVERPASVVKELVENALDAGATRVRVEVREGGAAYVGVTDDGHGMSPDDARLALQRHATSKLARVEDLRRITSFGFRGEALPSIASVARLRLLTRARGAAEGHELLLDGGKVLVDRAAGTAEGTRVEVADLFGHVPARRKFLKAPVTEWGHVADWLARVALVRPDVHFDLRRDDRPALAWPATDDALDRVAAVLSDEEAAALVPVERSAGSASVRGFVSRPDWHRGSGEGIHLFVNGRPVRDRLLRHAVLDVARDWLPRGRFPAAVLFLELPHEAVDVNVHPAKWEVRFADSRAIHHLVSQALRDAVSRRSWIGGAPPADPEEPAAPQALVSRAGAGERPEAGAGSTTDWIFATRPAGEPASAVGSRAFTFTPLRILGQALATYLVVEGGEGILLVDQHAAHERILYEGLRRSRLSGVVPAQALLAPLALGLEPAALAALAAAQEATRALGFEIEGFGEKSVLVRAVPALLAGHDPGVLVRALVDDLRDAELAGAAAAPGARSLPLLDRALATLACHAARRKGDRLDPREQRALLDGLDGIPWAPTCPHGRPVVVPLDRAEIERRFARR